MKTLYDGRKIKKSPNLPNGEAGAKKNFFLLKTNREKTIDLRRINSLMSYKQRGWV